MGGGCGGIANFLTTSTGKHDGSFHGNLRERQTRDREKRRSRASPRACLKNKGVEKLPSTSSATGQRLAHPDKLTERVQYFSEQHQAERERLISPHELLTWTEPLTVATREHPRPLPSYNFSSQFPDFPFIYRRSVIKDAIGKVRSYLSNLINWNAPGNKKGQPGSPGASNHPTLYGD